MGVSTTMTTRSEPEPDASDPRLGEIVRERRQLINLAYRLLGSLAEAEDAVQEACARWYALSRAQRDEIESPAAWLTRVASRVCLDQLGSARARRERYVGEWLPEPLPDRSQWAGVRPGPAVDPADRITLDESVTMAFLVVLEAMTPAERVALVLHDVFGYSFAEVADIVGRTPQGCRQLAWSARRRLRSTRPDPVPAADQAGLVRDFRLAWEAKDVAALVGLLDPGVTAVADGGGRVHAAVGPIEGSERVARAFVEIAELGVTIAECTVNGQPGLVAQQEGVVVAVVAFEIADGRVTRVWAVRNPEKLRPWTAG